MEDIQLTIAKHELSNLVLQLNIERSRHHQTPEPSWRPSFSKLLEKYMTEHGWYLRAAQLKRNGENVFSRARDMFQNHYIPFSEAERAIFRPKQTSCAGLSMRKASKPRDMLDKIFDPLVRANRRPPARHQLQHRSVQRRYLLQTKPGKKSMKKKGLLDAFYG